MLSKMLQIFTKEYKKETEYIETGHSMLNGFKLKTKGESIGDKVKRLSDKNFVSQFRLNIRDY